MPLLLALAAITLGWLLITGKLKLVQLPPALLALAATIAATRGEMLAGLVGLAIAAAWYQGQRIRLRWPAKPKNTQIAVEQARALLGASTRDDAEAIRALHRRLIAQSHPDKGGSEIRATELNKARDLLLTQLQKKAS
jgi:DnaJ homolog subfamily C member 19